MLYIMVHMVEQIFAGHMTEFPKDDIIWNCIP